MAYKVLHSGEIRISNRPVLPGQNTNDWVHPFKGAGEYSNWSLMSTTQPLQDMPLRDHVPGSGNHPSDSFMTSVFLGEHNYAPMEMSKFNHGGQDVPYFRHAHWEYHGVPAAEVFHSGDWGYSLWDERNFTFSRHSNYFFYGVDSADLTLEGRPARYWDDEDLPTYATRHAPYEYKGVGDDRLEGDILSLDDKYALGESGNEYAWQRTQEWKGVPSGSALGL